MRECSSSELNRAEVEDEVLWVHFCPCDFRVLPFFLSCKIERSVDISRKILSDVEDMRFASKELETKRRKMEDFSSSSSTSLLSVDVCALPFWFNWDGVLVHF